MDDKVNQQPAAARGDELGGEVISRVRINTDTLEITQLPLHDNTHAPQVAPGWVERQLHPLPQSGCCSADVYFSAEADNYYCRACNSGQGNDYHAAVQSAAARAIIFRLQADLFSEHNSRKTLAAERDGLRDSFKLLSDSLEARNRDALALEEKLTAAEARAGAMREAVQKLLIEFRCLWNQAESRHNSYRKLEELSDGHPTGIAYRGVMSLLAKASTIDCPACGRDWGHSYCGVCKGEGKIDAALSPASEAKKPEPEVGQ